MDQNDLEIDRDEALERYMWDMADPSIHLVNDYIENGLYGIDLTQRLLWEGYVMRQDIERPTGSEYDGGRPSVPEFQDANFKPLKKKPALGNPRPVLLQYEEDPEKAMCPHSLLMSYEDEKMGRVAPVISDFDCFLVGTRRVTFKEELSTQQKDILKWQVNKIGEILDGKGKSAEWTMRWMEMLKGEMEHCNYEMPDVPKFGFGDPISYNMMGHAVGRLTQDGCVRHGAECFNYTFPQDLDDKFLILSSLGDEFAMEVDQKGLVEYLSKMADAGYIFPLNPKWILCDDGFKTIYDKLMANPSDNAKTAMNTWYPPETGIRQLIEDIHSRHPSGYEINLEDSFRVSSNDGYSPLRSCMQQGHDLDSSMAMDLAMMELNHHRSILKCRAAARAIMISISMYAKINKFNTKSSTQAITDGKDQTAKNPPTAIQEESAKQVKGQEEQVEEEQAKTSIQSEEIHENVQNKTVVDVSGEGGGMEVTAEDTVEEAGTNLKKVEIKEPQVDTRGISKAEETPLDVDDTEKENESVSKSRAIEETANEDSNKNESTIDSKPLSLSSSTSLSMFQFSNIGMKTVGMVMAGIAVTYIGVSYAPSLFFQKRPKS